LTGRENVFLNGAILGMTKTEIKSKFDEIVDFSGVERYIDTPVKRYSSGMMVRLGFAVAAHLEPEILVVDEVLAVGDAEFQKKAIGKMQDVSNNYGRTVLFVSHNMASVKTLCSRGIILENGRITQEGSTDQVISNYLKGNSELVNFKTDPNKPMIDLPDIEIYSIGVKANNKDYNDIITLDDKITFSTRYKQKTNSKFIHITIHLKDELGNVVFTNASSNTKIADDKEGLFDVSVVFPDNFFNWGSFYIDLYIVENKKNILVVEKDIVSFTVINKQQEIGQWMGKEAGPIHPRFDWQKMLIQ
jgi:lipopolysaccharide transport system ATP-binding protein